MDAGLRPRGGGTREAIHVDGAAPSSWGRDPLRMRPFPLAARRKLESDPVRMHTKRTSLRNADAAKWSHFVVAGLFGPYGMGGCSYHVFVPLRRVRGARRSRPLRTPPRSAPTKMSRSTNSTAFVGSAGRSAPCFACLRTQTRTKCFPEICAIRDSMLLA